MDTNKTLLGFIIPTKPLALSALTVLLVGCVSGCVGGANSAASQYGWSHSMSGDYLFSYDRSGCEQTAGSQAAPEFFSCMKDLGYFLIDPATGAPIAAADSAPADAEKPTAAAVTADSALR